MGEEIQNRPKRSPWLRVRTIAALAVIVALLSVACDARRAEAVRYYNEGMLAFELGNSSQAVGFMEQALEEDPTFTEAAYTLGQVYQQRMGDSQGAINAYRRALDHQPEDPRFAYRLATALADAGEHRQAIRYYDQAIRHYPPYALAFYGKARSQEADGQFLAAANSYGDSIRINPRLRMAADDIGGEHYHALADLYLRFRLYDHAVRVYENGVRNNPEAVRLYHGLGISQMYMNRHAEAVESFREALNRDPSHGSANFNIAVAMYESGDLESAITQLTKLIEEGGSGMSGPRRQAAEALLEDLTAERDEE